MSASLQLRLIPAATSCVVRAGFLPGSDAGVWLEEMARHPQAGFFGVPASERDLEAGGLLILLPDTAEKSPDFGPRVLPLALEHGRVAVPLSMQLDPQLTAEESARLLTYPVYFFHPAIGLVAFDDGDAVTPHALLLPPLPRESSWLRAVAGPVPPPPLGRVSLTLPEDFSEMLGNAAGDIGSGNPKDMRRKAPLKDRLADKLRDGFTPIGKALLGGLSGIAGMLGGGKGSSSGKGNSMMQRLRKWTAEQMEKLQRQRESEIQRLLKLLEKNPEEGLRYALPLTGGANSSRGVASPGGILSLRNPVFGGQRGSGPADMWDLSQKTQWELQQKYRALANREIAEGRFDRAAYIFAELLGDWQAAAGALSRGRRHQEAAQIYLQRLNNKPMAARCLEEGGLLSDALLLYAELRQHEKCGDLCHRLGRESEASAYYREALAGNSDRLHDARILFDKLRQPTLALAVLASGWPQSPRASACLEKQFEYLTQLGAHEDALALAKTLGDPALRLRPTLTMVKSLKTIRESQPDARVQEALSKAAFEVIGEALAGKLEAERPLLNLLPKFAPADLLLRRDAGRFAEVRAHESRRKKKNALSPARGDVLTWQGTFGLQPKDGVTWGHFTSRGCVWLAGGFCHRSRQDVWIMGEGLKLMGQFFSGKDWAASLALPPLLTPARMCAWLPMSRRGTAPGYGQIWGNEFGSYNRAYEPLVERLGWIPRVMHAVCPDDGGTWILHAGTSGTLDLSFFDSAGRLVRTHALTWNPPQMPGPVRMACHNAEVFISAGPHFLHVRHGQIINTIELDHPVIDLQTPGGVHASCVLMVTRFDVLLFNPAKDGGTTQLFSGVDYPPPAACFLADGRVVVGDHRDGLIYSGAPETKLLGPLKHMRSAKRGGLQFTSWEDDGLAILWDDGQVEFFV